MRPPTTALTNCSTRDADATDHPPTRRRCLARLLAAGAVSSSGLVGLAWAADSGSPADDMHVRDEDWHDSGRDRVVPVRIRQPGPGREAPPGGWPVLLFSHGLGGTREGGAVFGQAWAQAGFVVVHLQHPGSDWPALAGRPALGSAGSAAATRSAGAADGAGVAASAASAPAATAAVASVNGTADTASPDSGQAIGMARRLQAAMQPAQLLARLGDVRFALDELARRPLGRPQRVGLAGHSFGAHTTLAMAGQAWAGFAGVQEPRLAAFLALSPLAPKPQPGLSPAEALAGIRRPMLLATGSLDGEVVGNGATPESRRQVFELLPPGHKALLWLHQADHMSFAGQTGRALEALRPRSGSTRRAQPQHHALITQASTDWFRAHLMDDAAAVARLRQAPAGLGPDDRWLTG